jgi:hypothetical protein
MASLPDIIDAVVSPDGTWWLCGACLQRLARVGMGSIVERGFVLHDDGGYRMSARAREKLRRGYSPSHRRALKPRPGTGLAADYVAKAVYGREAPLPGDPNNGVSRVRCPWDGCGVDNRVHVVRELPTDR